MHFVLKIVLRYAGLEDCMSCWSIVAGSRLASCWRAATLVTTHEEDRLRPDRRQTLQVVARGPGEEKA
jgi:hypothetical protein